MKSIKMVALAVLALAVAFACGCGGRHSNKEIFYLISADSALPYWQTAAAGFKQAATEYKVTARVVGPEGHDPQAELAELQKAVAARQGAFSSRWPTFPSSSRGSMPPSKRGFP